MKKNGLLVFIVLQLTVFGAWGSGEAEDKIVLSRDQLYDFREVYVGMWSEVQFYDVSVAEASEKLLVSVASPFAISLDCHAGFTDSLFIDGQGGHIPPTRIFVRFFPGAEGGASAAIRHEYPAAATRLVALTGTATACQIPEAYYSTATSAGSELKTQLHDIIKEHREQTYASLWTHFETTDATFAGKVWDIYSDLPCAEPPYLYTFVTDQDRGMHGSAENQVFNREHSMPVSWFGGQQNPMFTDLFHIYPTDKWVNALRDNYPYGEVGSATTVTMNGGRLGNNSLEGYAGIAFEPVDAYKGDLARTYFYMITRYEDRVTGWTGSPQGNQMLDHHVWPGYKPWAIDMLMSWHRNDPVSQKEIMRNNAVYRIQGNRNPFIDHPGFAERIWAADNTGIALKETPLPLRLYPNPAASFFLIEADEYVEKLTLFTPCGKALTTGDHQQTQLRVDLDGLPPGIYMARITLGSGVYHKKIIIY